MNPNTKKPPMMANPDVRYFFIYYFVSKSISANHVASVLVAPEVVLDSPR